MSKPSLRQHLLLNSVRKLVDDSEQVQAVVMLWTRHRLFVPYCIFAGIVLFIVGSVSGIDGLVNRAVIAGCGVAVAGLATTNHWVLAQTDRGLLLLESSRIRQYAKRLACRLDASTPLEMVGSTVVTSDWRIDGTIYTMTKRWESTMRSLATKPA